MPHVAASFGFHIEFYIDFDKQFDTAGQVEALWSGLLSAGVSLQEALMTLVIMNVLPLPGNIGSEI